MTSLPCMFTIVSSCECPQLYTHVVYAIGIVHRCKIASKHACAKSEHRLRVSALSTNRCSTNTTIFTAARSATLRVPPATTTAVREAAESQTTNEHVVPHARPAARPADEHAFDPLDTSACVPIQICTAHSLRRARPTHQDHKRFNEQLYYGSTNTCRYTVWRCKSRSDPTNQHRQHIRCNRRIGDKRIQ